MDPGVASSAALAAASSYGLGRATAQALLYEGADVVINERSILPA